MKKWLLFCLMAWTTSVAANQVAIRDVQLHQANGAWTLHVTLEHKDTGWEHYADAWRIVSARGDVIGTRTLYHPHVKEQPFTRSLTDVVIPDNIAVVYIEAHDTVHGWSQDRVKVDMTKNTGDRYQIRR